MFRQTVRHRLGAIAMGVILGTSSTSAAQPASETARFDVYFLGLKAGEMQLGMKSDGAHYAVSGKADSGGLIAAISGFRFRAKTQGSVRGEDFAPTRYEENSDNGERKTDTVLVYRDGVPKIEKVDKLRDHWLDPASQRGLIDPLTAFWQVLRDRPRASLCTQSIRYFDGGRRVRFTLSDARIEGDTVICQGQYIREGGFSKKAMREGDKYPFSLTYKEAGDGMWQVDRVDAKTRRGRALLIRR